MARRLFSASLEPGVEFMSSYLQADLALAPESGKQQRARIVVIGSAISEIVYALGKGHLLMNQGFFSTASVEVTCWPQVGVGSALSLEALASLSPDLVIASQNTRLPAMLEQIRALGISVELLTDRPGLDSLFLRIRQVANALNTQACGEVLVEGLQQELSEVRRQVLADAGGAAAPQGLVVIRRSDQFQIAGHDTAAAALLHWAGLEAVAPHSRGYKVLEARELRALDPDFIVTSTTSVGAAGGWQAFCASAGLSRMRAARQGRVVLMEEALMLEMGLRVARAAGLLYAQTRRVKSCRAKWAGDGFSGVGS